MAVDPLKLFEFVGIVLPVSFIGLRILLDELDQAGGVSARTQAKVSMNHAMGMIALLVAAGWLATLDILLSLQELPLAELGHFAAALGITVPVWLLWSLRNEVTDAELPVTSRFQGIRHPNTSGIQRVIEPSPAVGATASE